MIATGKSPSASALRKWRPYILSAFFGALFGLSAPGFDQWYLAYVGLVPFFLLVASSPSAPVAALRGLVFGTAYNLVYLNWFLGLYPLDWLGFAPWQSAGIAGFCWLFEGTHQGLIIAAIAFLLRLVPLSGNLLPRFAKKQLLLPALSVLPLAYVLLSGKVLNNPDLLGVPWTLIEYSQYKQGYLLQMASIVGGPGIGVMLVAANVAVAVLVATFSAKAAFKPLCADTRQHAVVQALAVALMFAGSLFYGHSLYERSRTAEGPSTQLSVVQGNINIQMQKTVHKYSCAELLDIYTGLARKAPPGVCVFTESCLPTYLTSMPGLVVKLSELARTRKCDLIVGSVDSDDPPEVPYNGAFAFTRSGALLPEVYHKRYLVPVGEYTPEFVKYLPEFLQRLTNTPAGTGFGAGTRPEAFQFASGCVAPLICFETISPELAVQSVRYGGQLLVNISDLAWFHDSMVGVQTQAFAAFRAVETGRYFVYAANTGPSFVMSPQGEVLCKTRVGARSLLTSEVRYLSDLTPFVQWFH